MKILTYILVGVAGCLIGVLAATYLQKPCPECPGCPDALLEVQPFQINADELRQLRRNNITITYSPQYTGNISICDSIK